MLCSEEDPKPQISPFTPGHIFGSYHKTPNFGRGICSLPKVGGGGAWEREERESKGAEVNCGSSRQVAGLSLLLHHILPLLAHLLSTAWILEAWSVELWPWQCLSIVRKAGPGPHRAESALQRSRFKVEKRSPTTPRQPLAGRERWQRDSFALRADATVSLEATLGKHLSSEVVYLCLFLKADWVKWHFLL